MRKTYPQKKKTLCIQNQGMVSWILSITEGISQIKHKTNCWYWNYMALILKLFGLEENFLECSRYQDACQNIPYLYAHLYTHS